MPKLQKSEKKLSTMKNVENTAKSYLSTELSTLSTFHCVFLAHWHVDFFQKHINIQKIYSPVIHILKALYIKGFAMLSDFSTYLSTLSTKVIQNQNKFMWVSYFVFAL